MAGKGYLQKGKNNVGINLHIWIMSGLFRVNPLMKVPKPETKNIQLLSEGPALNHDDSNEAGSDL